MLMTKTTTTRRADVVHMRPPMKNPSRERMKAEIHLLRDELAKLEANKQLLVKQKRKGLSESNATTPECMASSDHLVRAELRQEREKRRVAQQENKRLRKALSQQLQTIKSMATTLHAHALLDAAWPILERRPSLSNVLNDDYGYRFAALADSTNQIYRQVDQMIQFASHDSEHPMEFTSALTSRKVNEQELLMLEGRETTVIPFDFEHCHNAMWKAIRETSWSECRKAFVHSSTADCVMVRMFSSHTVRGETVGMTVSRVIKRFVEDERVVFVWRAVSSLDGHELDGDVYIDESGWAVMQRVAEEDKDEFAVNKVCSQWTPRSFSQYEDDRAVAIHPGTSACTNLVLAASVGDAMEINELMENLLIDDCMDME